MLTEAVVFDMKTEKHKTSLRLVVFVKPIPDKTFEIKKGRNILREYLEIH